MRIIRNILPLKEFHTPDAPYMSVDAEQMKSITGFNRSVSEKAIEFEEVPCLCGSEEFYLIARRDRYSMMQDTVMCARCGMVLSNPRMTEAEYAKFYKNDLYRQCYEQSGYMDGYKTRYSASTGQHILNAIIKVRSIDKIKSVLEFGAGGGWNLVAFKDRGINTTGYEYSPTLVSLGRAQGLDLFQGGIDSVKGKYDVIILNQVIEHFTNLRTDIEKLKEHLNEGGLFYIAVPNIVNFSMGQLQNAHVYYFTPATLRYYMAQSGLTLIHTEAAEEIHLAAIFILAPSELKIDFLQGNVKTMLNVFKRYYIGESAGNLFQAIGLKTAMRRLTQNRIANRLKEYLYK